MEEQYVNISEVCQQTGVAAVTLRAWERRYGLIKPKRTPKGHRLYTAENIDQIRQIVKWLDRGVAISKVAALIEADEELPLTGVGDDTWQTEQQSLLADVIKLKQIALDQALDKLNKSMPMLSLCEQVYQPLISQLVLRWQSKQLGYQLEQQLWNQAWQRQITIMTLRANKQKPRASCWLIQISELEQSLDYWLIYALLLEAGMQVNAMNQFTDLKALPRLKKKVEQPLIIFGHHSVAATDIPQLIKSASIWQQDTIVIGSIAEIHHEVLHKHGITHVGGQMSACWQTETYQSWLKKVQYNDE